MGGSQFILGSASPGLVVMGALRKEVEQALREQASKQHSFMISVSDPALTSSLIPFQFSWIQTMMWMGKTK